MIKVVFHTIRCKHVNKEASLLSRGLGAIIREICSMDHAYWNDVPEVKRNDLMDEITMSVSGIMLNIQCFIIIN